MNNPHAIRALYRYIHNETMQQRRLIISRAVFLIVTLTCLSAAAFEHQLPRNVPHHKLQYTGQYDAPNPNEKSASGGKSGGGLGHSKNGKHHHGSN